MLCLAACLTAGVVAIAQAEELIPGSGIENPAPDPYAACEENGALATVAGNCGPSTDQVPGQPGDTNLFDLVHGARYPETKAQYEDRVRETAVTSFDDNLYTVAFSLQQGVGGIAGGANCENSEPNETNPAELGDPSTHKEYGCVPVLYQYKTFDPTHGAEWRKVDLPGDDDPGYVGAVAWISNTGQALAVGGTGRYPRRDPAYRETEDPNNPTSKPCQQWDVLDDAPGAKSGQRRRLIGAYGANCDPAGSARAWLYNKDGDGRWEEITDDLPTQIPPQELAAAQQGAVFFPDTNDPNFSSDATSDPANTDWGHDRSNSLYNCVDPTEDPDAKNPFVPPGRRICRKNRGPAPISEPAKTYTRRGMGGLSALDCDPALGADYCFAGGLGQMWTWQSGKFAKEPFDSHSVPPKSDVPGGLADAKGASWRFRFRVRQVRFLPGEPTPRAYAVTAGCCADSTAKNQPWLLTHLGDASQSWFVGAFRTAPADGGGGSTSTSSLDTGPLSKDALQSADSVTPYRHRPDSLYSVMEHRGNTGVSPGPYPVSAIASPGGPSQPGEPPSEITSQYCSGATVNDPPGVLYATNEPPNLLYDAGDLTRLNLSTARLIAGDGDRSVDVFQLDKPFRTYYNPLNAVPPLTASRGSPASYSAADSLDACTKGSKGVSDRKSSASSQKDPADSVPDWVVGELRSTDKGLGARGLLWANPQRPGFAPETFASPIRPEDGNKGSIDLSNVEVGTLQSGGSYSTVPLTDLTGVPPNYTPTTPQKLQNWAKAPYFALPSYGLNAIDIVGESASGWAVGDHGAILRLNGDETAKQAPEPELPHLGARRPAALPDSSPYAAQTPAQDAAPGEVPSLASQPRERLAEPRLVAAGAPDAGGANANTFGTSANSIAMSRDGSEGWAVGGGGATTLYHYDGAEWSLCDPKGVPGQLPPDPACAGVAAIYSFTGNTGTSEHVRLRSIARVPLEKDSDPANDDEFEAVAVGTPHRDRTGALVPTILRYRDGRWDFEDSTALAGADLSSVAFTAPDDGWTLSTDFNTTSVYHFDGVRWAKCASRSSPCFDPDGHLSDGAIRSIDASGSGLPTVGLIAAGDRVYLYGDRTPAVPSRPSGDPAGQVCPVILYHDRGAASWRGSTGGEDGSLDPGYDRDSTTTHSQPCDAWEMQIDSFTVARRADGRFEGWAFGQRNQSGSIARPQVVLRLTADGVWRHFEGGADDALHDYFRQNRPTNSASDVMVARPDGGLDAFVSASGRLLKFNPDRERWGIVDSAAGPALPNDGGAGGANLLAPDNEGGFWAGDHTFLHYTLRPPKPVFAEAPNPAGPDGHFVGASPGANGQLWLATNSNTLYRYDRAGGWDTVKVSGWDPGRVVTRPSSASAIAVNSSGVGVLVGEKGRIADITGLSVRLDEAAGAPLNCRIGTPPPCGTGRDLEAAAVAPEGSAIVAGRSLALLWRDGANGPFQAIDKPDAAAQVTINAVAMPSRDRAYLTTDTGFLFRGDLDESAPGRWRWTLENTNAKGDALIYDPSGRQLALGALAVDDSGHGFAVGEHGLVLERMGDGTHPWRRLKSPFLDNLTAVALPTGGGAGALVGAENGAIYTFARGRFEMARAPDIVGQWGGLGVPAPQTVGVALLGGPRAGQTEAWAVLQRKVDGTSALLHYSNDPDEPLLDPARRAQALPDTEAPRAGELSFATFGGTRCLRPQNTVTCNSMALTTEDFEAYTQGIVDAIAVASKRPGGPAFSVFSGDMIHPYPAGAGGGANVRSPAPPLLIDTTTDNVSAAYKGSPQLRRFGELVADRLEEQGVPFYATLGGGESSSPDGGAVPWRLAMANRRTPWGAGPAPDAHGLSFEAVPDGPDALRTDKTKLPTGLGTAGDAGVPPPCVPAAAGQPPACTPLGETRVQTNPGGADTHYAFDVSRGDQKIARFVFADSSQKTLGPGSDPSQNPIESKAQMNWLDSMLCPVGQRTPAPFNTPCTRDPAEQAIVVTNTPTYSYGNQSQNNVMGADASLFESMLFRDHANLVISGRIGWNGLYYALSNSLHDPQPGGSYPPAPPEPLPGQPDPIPFVVASGGGRFAEDASDTSSAPAGYWHGYTVVRLDATGDYRKTIVEQRALLDWLHVSADKHVLRPGSKLALHGVGREPLGTTPNGGTPLRVRFDEISNAAITHRYELVYADPEKPWVPKQGEHQDKCDPYDCLPGDVGSIDDQSGVVTAGGGQQERTYALAILSVGAKTATFPLVFEPRPSFRAPPPPPAIALPPASTPPPAPAPPAPAPPFQPPTLATPPPLAPLPAQTPPAPPVPPAPPDSGVGQLDLFTSPPVLSVAPGVSLFPPSAPVINVAPPTPARPVEKAKKVAVQKSGSGIGDEGKSKARAMGGDLANAPDAPDHAMTRKDPNAFTAIAHREQASAWARNLQWGGGLTMAALVLFLGFVTVRPTPKRRQPEVPSPAFSEVRRR